MKIMAGEIAHLKKEINEGQHLTVGGTEMGTDANPSYNTTQVVSAHRLPSVMEENINIVENRLDPE